MRNLLIVCVAATAVLFGANCGNSDRTPEKLCEKYVGCEVLGDQETCLQSLGSLVLTDACMDEILAASCEDHNSGHPSYWDNCFDGCFTAGRACDGDRLITCDGTTEFIYDCLRVCRYSTGGAYTGTCGSVGPNGELSDRGDVCWCQVQ